MKDDHRHNNRQAMEYPAQIHAGADARFPCLLRDVSESGARILLPASKGIPDDFVLLLAHDGTASRNCHVVWRTERELGVKFQSMPKPAPTKPLPYPQPSDEPSSEVVKLDT